MAKLLNYCNVGITTLFSYKNAKVSKMKIVSMGISLKHYFFRNIGTETKVTSHNEQQIENSLYPSHIPTTPFHKIALSIGSSFVCVTNPKRADMIAILGETTGYYALKKIHSNMLTDEEGKEILFQKPRINSNTVDLNKLSKLPQNTLGYAYHKFLTDNNVTPDSRLPVKFVDDAELAYVLQRYREVHDLFHTILGMPTNMQGEVAVKWVEALQLGLPMCIAAALFGPIRFKPKQRKNYVKSYLPWAFTVGKNSKPLINIFYERRWEQDISDLRTEFNIKPFSL